MHRMGEAAAGALVLIALVGGCQSEDEPPAEAPPVKAPEQVREGTGNIRLTSLLPYALNKNKLDSGFVYGKAGGRANALVRGSGSVQSNDNPPPKLAVAHVAHPDGSAVVRLDLGSGVSGDLLHMLRQRTGEPAAPLLVDVDGKSYHAVGYVVRSGDGFSFAFDPQKPLRRLGDMNIGSVGPGQSLWLYYVIPADDSGKIKTLARVRHGAHDLQKFPYFPK